MDAPALSLDVEVDVGSLPSEAAATVGRRWLESLLCAVGLVTACMSVAAAIYKAPAGVFYGHGRAYYAFVLLAGVAGLAEACAAVIWLSGVGPTEATDGQRQRVVRRWVLCASLLPLAFVAGMGGVRVLLK